MGASVWRVPDPRGDQVWKDYRHLDGTWRGVVARTLVKREARALARIPAGIGPALCAHDSPLVLAMAYLPHRPLAPGDGDKLIDLMEGLMIMQARGVAHNDLHRSNVCIHNDRAVLLDFGAATLWPSWLQGPLYERDKAHLLTLAGRHGASVSMPESARWARTLQSIWRRLRKIVGARRHKRESRVS